MQESKVIHGNRLVPENLLRDKYTRDLNYLFYRLSKRWVMDSGYTNALGQECVLLLCKIEDL